MVGSFTYPADEAEIRAHAARTLAGLFDSLYEGAVAIDRAGRILWMNNKYKALLGWNGTDPVEGQMVEEVIPNSRMREVVESGRADLVDIFPIGQRQTVVSRIPLHDETGEVVGALGLILYDRVQALKPLVSKFQRLQEDLANAQKQLAEQRKARYGFNQFVGASDAVRTLKRAARRAAERDATVLLLGETGTGKELLAHAIHASSPRGDKAMVRVNVAAIPETLLEAELFGTAPGAYTGADRKGRLGKFQVADGGTLFLDEIGDMPLTVQSKLLRVLQEGEVEALGANTVRMVDVRVIAATSRDLTAMVEAGTFRADLYYRLNVLPLHLPPLRERLSDLPLLCDALLEAMADSGDGETHDVARDGIARLKRHDWPGNVRELRNILEQAVANSDAAVLSAADFDAILPPDTSAATSAGGDSEGRSPAPVTSIAPGDVTPLRDVVAAAERQAILHALEATGGVRTQAARLLGISRAQFYEKLTNLGVVSGETDTSDDVRYSGHAEKSN